VKKKIKAPPKIVAFFSDEEMTRIEKGPLGATSGRGKAAWLHNVAMRAVKEAEDKIRADPKREKGEA